ncbi:MAG: Smr/MutS family protein [Acidobacteria bacterium]|nr:Smr/MutS family protein [Acidobacteriota bacterium]
MVTRPKEDSFEKVFLSGQWRWISNLQAEHVEAAHPSVSRLTLRKLRRGYFSVRAECDLHGMTQQEARQAVTVFIRETARQHLGCVRIIHGKGNKSQDKIPILKSCLEVWLSSKKLSRYVLAYSSARPCDGGTGAMYVLLRNA